MRFVITSVNYADFLAETLPAWKAIVPEGLIVATSPADLETQRVADVCKVNCVTTDAWAAPCVDHQGGPPKFNLGHGLNVALGLCEHSPLTRPQVGELIGHASADCYPVGSWVSESALTLDKIYGVWRYSCLTPKHLSQHKRGERSIRDALRLKNSGGKPIGYFQMFRYTTGRLFPSYATAGKFDTEMVTRFLAWQMRDEFYLLHLGEHDNHKNWSGRVLPKWEAAS